MIQADQQRVPGKLIEVRQPQQLQAVEVSAEIKTDIDFEPTELPFGYRRKSASELAAHTGCGLNMGALDTSIVVKTVGRNPAGHQHYRHPGSGVGRSASQIKAAQAGILIGRLKAALQSPMACDAVDRAIKYTVALVNILVGSDSSPLQWQTRDLPDRQSASIHLESPDDAWIHLLPILSGAQIWRVYQDLKRFLPRRFNSNFPYGMERIGNRLAQAQDRFLS